MARVLSSFFSLLKNVNYTKNSGRSPYQLRKNPGLMVTMLYCESTWPKSYLPATLGKSLSYTTGTKPGREVHLWSYTHKPGFASLRFNTAHHRSCATTADIFDSEAVCTKTSFTSLQQRQ
jgi:hypothetical protein